MSSDTPAAPAYRLRVLEEHRDIFETIRDSDLDAEFREKYGQRPLDELQRLRQEVDNAE